MTREYWRVIWTQFERSLTGRYSWDNSHEREFESEELAIHFARQKRIDGGTHIQVHHVIEKTSTEIIQRYG